MSHPFESLPPVDRIATALAGRGYPHSLVVREARRVLDEYRERIRKGDSEVDGAAATAEVAARLEQLRRPSLRKVINASGVILHTNLGRAPLPAFTPISGYSNLEYDLAAGRRGKRDSHVSPLLERLTGKPSIVVNNNAAATWLVLNELAAGGEVLVSRGELIEIGDGFRIPDIMARSGAVLKEVGTTNKTRIEDYRRAVTERTRLIMRVHPSNFHITGFASRPELSELAALSRETGIPLYEDLGSGCLVDLRPYGVQEPLVSESIRAGVSILSFSGDKLLGGSQAGILSGDATLVQRVRRNQMFRAFRVDKLITQALEESLRAVLFERYDLVPALRMLMLDPDAIRGRAVRFAAEVEARVVEGESLAGGGSTPDQSLPTWLVRLPSGYATAAVERRLRMGDPPVIVRIEDDAILIDLRTVAPEDEPALMRALVATMPAK
jgi:L-seryl-tRNA(Ser) seleniumtransferase